MKKILVFVLLLTLNISHGVAEELRIGAIASLQGGASEQGQSWLQGVQLAVEELNRNGENVRLIIEDDQTQPAKAATAFNKLARIDSVAGVIGGTWDYLGEAIYPLAKREKIPLLTPSNPSEVLSASALQNPFVFTNGLSLKAERRAIASFLDKRQAASAAIVSVHVPFSIVHAELVKSLLQSRGAKILDEIEFALEEPLTSFRTAAQRVARKKPDLVYIVADYNALDIFCSELQNHRVSPLVLTTQHLEGAYELSRHNDERYARVFGVYPAYDRHQFDSRYRERFGRAPRVFAAEGYDGLRFLVAALHEKISFSSPLARFQWQGLKGEYRIPAPGRALVEDSAVIVRIQRGELLIEE